MKVSGTRVPEPVKHVAHAGWRTYGRLTAGDRLLPSFLICGGQRCGTTSLYRALAAHPAILKAVLHKGVHYFDTGWERGPRWYRAHFPSQRAADRVREATGVQPQTFESSPYYMYHPLAPRRIAAALPTVKLLVLVRDPVERAYSQHAHEVARGFETLESFPDALAAEPRRLAGEEERLANDPTYYSFSHQHHAYLARGEYAVRLARLAEVIGRDRVQVVESERFFTTPEKVYDEVLAFLGLPRMGYPPFARHNARPRPAPMDAGLRAALWEYYAPYDAHLEEWLGRPPIWRLR